MQCLPTKKPAETDAKAKQSKTHNSSTYSLSHVIGRLHNAPPLRAVLLLTDAPLRRPIRHSSRNGISGKLHAIVVGEDAFGVDLAEAGAEVDGDGVVGGIKFDATVLVDAGFVVGGSCSRRCSRNGPKGLWRGRRL